MKTCLLLIAHAPLASALRACALHVFPECDTAVLALDIAPDAQPQQMCEAAHTLLQRSGAQQTLVLSDVVGATPCNVAQSLTGDDHVRLLAGVNLPMVLRAITYREEPIASLVERARLGGQQGVVELQAMLECRGR